eukprot:TRINITY_DN33117_c0_g1_i1.p1 TRINITY_DN33117_c0_g1~~TRINITY_DN33117_c0_g1_i1.p1  ORF type:complete len:478 (+),score=92.48 TRINITY_DN33117_c0_g1_i1:32-1435(+)
MCASRPRPTASAKLRNAVPNIDGRPRPTVSKGYDPNAPSLPFPPPPPPLHLLQPPAFGGIASPMQPTPAWFPHIAQFGDGFMGAVHPVEVPRPVRVREPEPPPNFEDAVQWFELDEAAPLVLEGFPAMAPALRHELRLQNLLSSASYILFELLGETANSVTLTHDWEWTEYPEVGEIVKQVFNEELPLCVARVDGPGARKKWGVGLATNNKHRVQVARLALCVAVAADAESLQSTFSNHPGFRQLLVASGVDIGDLPEEEEVGGTVPHLDPVEESQPRKRPRQCLIEEATAMPEGGLMPTKPGKAGALPRHIPLWIELEPEAARGKLRDLQADAPVLATDGSKHSPFSNPDAILSAILGDEARDVEYHDDFDWKKFPAVGSALKKLAPVEECMCVAICEPRELWAVGVANKGKDRWAAAKVAIAVAVALQQVEILQEPANLKDYPAMEKLVEAAGASRMAALAERLS